MEAYFIQEALRKLLILENSPESDKDYQDILQGESVEVVKHKLNKEVWLISRRAA